MKKDWVLTQEAFDTLLDWLDADRDGAGKKYESIRCKLIKIFTCRGCGEAEDLADETINRVTARTQDVASAYQGDPAHYFYGVAQKVYMEYLRRRPLRQAPPPPLLMPTDEPEEEYECLEQCMEGLPPENRRFVLEYYQEEKRSKIEHRKKLAEQMGLAINALRIRAHRIRLVLQDCVQHCLEQKQVH